MYSENPGIAGVILHADIVIVLVHAATRCALALPSIALDVCQVQENLLGGLGLPRATLSGNDDALVRGLPRTAATLPLMARCLKG